MFNPHSAPDKHRGCRDGLRGGRDNDCHPLSGQKDDNTLTRIYGEGLRALVTRGAVGAAGL